LTARIEEGNCDGKNLYHERAQRGYISPRSLENAKAHYQRQMLKDFFSKVKQKCISGTGTINHDEMGVADVTALCADYFAVLGRSSEPLTLPVPSSASAWTLSTSSWGLAILVRLV